MNDMVVTQVAYHDLPAVWDIVEPLYNKAAETSHNPPPLVAYIPALQARLAQLWCMSLEGEIRGMMLTELVDTPAGRIARILAIAAHDMQRFRSYQETFELWAAVNGAQAIEAICNDRLLAIHAKYGFAKVANVIRKALPQGVH
jgi:hypothetical protein